MSIRKATFAASQPTRWTRLKWARSPVSGAIAGAVIAGPEGFLIGTAGGVMVAAGHIVIKHRELTLPAGTELIFELDAPATASHPHRWAACNNSRNPVARQKYSGASVQEAPELRPRADLSTCVKSYISEAEHRPRRDAQVVIPSVIEVDLIARFKARSQPAREELDPSLPDKTRHPCCHLEYCLPAR